MRHAGEGAGLSVRHRGDRRARQLRRCVARRAVPPWRPDQVGARRARQHALGQDPTARGILSVLPAQ